MKAKIKSFLLQNPSVWNIYWSSKQFIRRIGMARYYIYDWKNSHQWMNWINRKDFSVVCSELIFYSHKIEKSLCLGGSGRLFGTDAVKQTIFHCNKWSGLGFNEADPIFYGAIESIRSYRNHITETQAEENKEFVDVLDKFLKKFPEKLQELQTPVPLENYAKFICSDNKFREILENRRSVRDFKPAPVPEKILRNAVFAGLMAPSACNRQPCKVMFLSEKSDKDAILSLQNGNRGFGHLAPHVAVILADESSFFDFTERHEPYIDGGLFSMNFISSLTNDGIGSCCLNWCVPPSIDKAAHEVLGIPQSMRIVMLIAIGYPTENCKVPKSARKSIDSAIFKKSGSDYPKN